MTVFGRISEYKEWYELLPGYHLAVLESPADVGDFFRGARADPTTPPPLVPSCRAALCDFFRGARADTTTPRVGFIANTTLSLGSGFSCGATNTSGKYAARHDRVHHELAEIETQEYEAAIKAKRGSEASAEATDDDESPSRTTYTHARDKPLRHRPPRLRNGLTCPRCGRLVRTKNGEKASAATLKKSGLAKVTCAHCGEHLGQMSRERDNVQDREREIFQSEQWLQGHPDVPWGTIPRSNPRYALGRLIGRRWKGWLDVYVADELHDYKGRTTAIGAAFGAMVSAASRTIGLTGTLFGGYASNLYTLLLRLGNAPVRLTYGWDDEKRFVLENGIVADITREVARINEAGHYSGEPRIEHDQQELPGVTANLGAVVQNQAIQVLLKHMGFQLVDYGEDAVMLDMPADVRHAYKNLESGGRGVISFGGHDALSSYLQATLTYPYQPWRPRTIESKIKEESVSSEVLPSDLVLPHHTWLADYASKQVQKGRRILVYCEHTGKDDIMSDIAAKMTRIAAEEHGITLKTSILRSTTVKPGDRAAWFSKQEAAGVNVVLCNPRLVKTGLNLVGWPSIVVLESVYSLYTLAQAVRRAFRPTQTVNCEVTYLAYTDTMSERALEIVAEKVAALALLSGDEISDGFASVGQGGSLMQELAKLVMEGDGDTMNRNIREMLQANAHAFVDEMRNGAKSLPGVEQPMTEVEVEQPEPLLAVVVGQPEPQVDVPSVMDPVQQPAAPRKQQTLWEQLQERGAAKRKQPARKLVVGDGQMTMF